MTTTWAWEGKGSVSDEWVSVMDRPQGECFAIVGVSGLYHSQGYRAMIGSLHADEGLGASFPAAVRTLRRMVSLESFGVGANAARHSLLWKSEMW